MSDQRDTLLLAFDRGLADPPAQDRRWLFLNAALLPVQGAALKPHLDCEQGFRPAFTALRNAGYDVEPAHSDGGGHAGAVVLAGRSRALNEANVARAWKSVAPGGVILVAGDNHDGIKSLRKWAAKWAGVEDGLVKHHAAVFSIRRDEREQPLYVAPQPRKGAWQVAPGMFSADGPDAGSQMLAAHFDGRIAGSVADFGAGWGWLGVQLLEKCPAVVSLDSIEADWLSLEAARENLAGKREDVALAFHWLDLTGEKPGRRYDWIVMNPPFHNGRAAEPALGIAFIEAASAALAPGGRLLMVANRQLPYEEALRAGFSRFESLEEAGGFKVIEALR